MANPMVMTTVARDRNL
uniref:Uncharacterized protein n=1 Tax=Rhizophora mucronata TaxID=61149 RepID=A0A2P2Q181_RHIMU